MPNLSSLSLPRLPVQRVAALEGRMEAKAPEGNVIRRVLLALVFLAGTALAQTECGSLQNLPALNAADNLGTVHKNVCWDPILKALTFPLYTPSASGFPVTTPQIVTTGGAITPGATGTGALGQIAANSDWFTYAPAAIAPGTLTLTAANTGGTLVQFNAVFVRVTFVGLSTVVPSVEVRIDLNTTGSSCASSACSVTVTMPTNCVSGGLPTGATGCTVWDDENTADAELQQTASAACVNITMATCVIGTLATGPTLASAVSASTGINPAGIVLGSQLDLGMPTVFLTSPSGSSYPLAQIDTTAFNFLTCCYTAGALTFTPPAIGYQPTFVWRSRFWLDDDVKPPPLSNALLQVYHEAGSTTGTKATPGPGVDDRAVIVRINDDTTATPNFEQKLGIYVENIVSNNAFTCNPLGSQPGETCAGGIRGIVSDTRSAPTTGVTGAFEGVVGVASSNGALSGTVCGSGNINACYVGVRGAAFEAQNNTDVAGNYAGGYFVAQAGTGDILASGFGVYVKPDGGSGRFAGNNVGVCIGCDNNTDYGSHAGDWMIFSASANVGVTGQSYFGGPMYMPNIVPDNSGTLSVSGSVSANGGLTTTQLAAPVIFSAIQSGGTAGTSITTYKTTCVDSNGNESTASPAFSTSATTTNNITSTNTIQIRNTGQVGCSSINYYRTASAATCNGVACTNGKIGNAVAANLGTSNNGNGTTNFTDTGQVGDGNSAVAQPNSTGGAELTGEVQDGGTCSPQTLITLSTSATTVCSFSLPALARTHRWVCDGTYSITAGTAPTFSIGMNASQTPTTETGTAILYSALTLTGNTGTTTATASGNQNINTTTGAITTITNAPWHAYGSIQASAAAGTFAITGTLGGTTPAGSIPAGTTICRIF